MAEHVVGDVFAGLGVRQAEVVYGRLVALACLNGLRVDKLPC